jgi:hypothetical protein
MPKAKMHDHMTVVFVAPSMKSRSYPSIPGPV